MTVRTVKVVSNARDVVDGVGVPLRRAFGSPEEAPLYDPFLLLDELHAESFDQFEPSFPQHPHRGMETVTYMLRGTMRHRDSLGNNGLVDSGGIQWITAGHGIVHEEATEQEHGGLQGFQLWINLPASHKDMAPRYGSVAASRIPTVSLRGNASARVLAGAIDDARGPLTELIAAPLILDISIEPGGALALPTPSDFTCVAYVIKGALTFEPPRGEVFGMYKVVLFEQGDALIAHASASGARLLLLAGKPLHEPIAWRGPIVVNTEEELTRSFEEYRNGAFTR